MTVKKPNKRQFILVGAAALLLVAVLIRYAPFPAGTGGLDGSTGDLGKQIAKYESRVAEKKLLEKHLLELGNQLAKAENGLLNGATPALAAVDLQNRLADIAGRSGVTIASQRVLRPPQNKEDEMPPFLEIPVQVTMTLTVRQLKEMLYQIAASSVYLHVSDAVVKTSKNPRDLQTNITVSGLMANREG